MSMSTLVKGVEGCVMCVPQCVRTFSVVSECLQAGVYLYKLLASQLGRLTFSPSPSLLS